MRRRTGWQLGLAMAMAMAALVPVDQGVLAQERRCRDSDASCWYLVGGIGEVPARIAWLARPRAGASQGQHRSIELVQVLEDRGAQNPYVIWRMQVDCAAGTFRAEERWLAGHDGLLARQPGEGQWTPAGEARHGESVAIPLACDPDVARGRSQAHVALFIGNAWRAPDAQAAFRQAFWEPPTPAP